MKTYPTELHLVAMEVEPCVWTIHEQNAAGQAGKLLGVSLVHVDDFIFAGDDTLTRWTTPGEDPRPLCLGVVGTRRRVAVRCRYQGGLRGLSPNAGEVRPGRQGGGCLEKRDRGPESDLTEPERSSLRSLCGDGMWLASQTMPQISAWVADSPPSP